MWAERFVLKEIHTNYSHKKGDVIAPKERTHLNTRSINWSFCTASVSCINLSILRLVFVEGQPWRVQSNVFTVAVSLLGRSVASTM